VVDLTTAAWLRGLALCRVFANMKWEAKSVGVFGSLLRLDGQRVSCTAAQGIVSSSQRRGDLEPSLMLAVVSVMVQEWLCKPCLPVWSAVVELLDVAVTCGRQQNLW
jgi:hypothetical protein